MGGHHTPEKQYLTRLPNVVTYPKYGMYHTPLDTWRCLAFGLSHDSTGTQGSAQTCRKQHSTWKMGTFICIAVFQCVYTAHCSSTWIGQG